VADERVPPCIVEHRLDEAALSDRQSVDLEPFQSRAQGPYPARQQVRARLPDGRELRADHGVSAS